MSGRVLVLGPLLAASTGQTERGRVLSFIGGAGKARAAPRPGVAPPAPDGEGFRRVVLPHLDAAHAFARYLCRDAIVAEDLVQDACLRAYRGFHNYRGGDAKAWLFAIVRSSFLEWVRGQRRWDAFNTDESGEDIPDETANAEAILMREADDAAVRQAVEDLPDPFREALVLRELQDMSYREIAEITEVPIGTVMSRLARARRLLGAALSTALGAEGVR
jgi:RNA polymerase sigma-70 factor (ECF subfamily)